MKTSVNTTMYELFGYRLVFSCLVYMSVMFIALLCSEISVLLFDAMNERVEHLVCPKLVGKTLQAASLVARCIEVAGMLASGSSCPSLHSFSLC